MTISVTCAECLKPYVLGEELGGKKIRCKACQATISVPVPNSDDEFPLDEDLLHNSGDEFDNDQDEKEFARRYARKSKMEQKAPAKRPRRKRSSSPGAVGSGMLKFLVPFVVVSILVRFVLTGNSLIPDWWSACPVPGVPGCTVEMPKSPQNKLDPRGVPMIYSEVRGFACAAISEDVNPIVKESFSDLPKHQNAFAAGVRALAPKAKFQGSRLLTMYGSPAIEFTLMVDNAYIIKRAFLANGRAITLDFISLQNNHPQMERFFGSCKGPGISSNTNAGAIPSEPAQAHPAQIPQTPIQQMPTPQTQKQDAKPNPTKPDPKSAQQAAASSANPPMANPVPAPSVPAPAKPGPAIDRRKVWSYTNAAPKFGENMNLTGSFVRGNANQWEELRVGGTPLSMIESGRTDEYIELSRNNGRFVIRLYADHSTISSDNGANFMALYPGKWE